MLYVPFATVKDTVIPISGSGDPAVLSRPGVAFRLLLAFCRRTQPEDISHLYDGQKLVIVANHGYGGIRVFYGALSHYDKRAFRKQN